MKVKNKLHFNFSYGELLQKALRKAELLRQDQHILSERGISPQRIAALNKMIEDFKRISLDVTHRRLIGKVPQLKNLCRK